MKETFTTLWIPFGDGRAARVRIDVHAPVLPTPLEVESPALPSALDLELIMHGIANDEWQDHAPFEIGLEPAPAAITRHAEERGKQRAGLSPEALARTAAKALTHGIKPAQTAGKLKRYLDGKAIEHGARPIVHGNHVFIFTTADVLVTLWELPHEFRKAAASALSKRALKQ